MRRTLFTAVICLISSVGVILTPPSGLEAALGDIETVAGSGTSGFSGDGGEATLAELGSPSGIAVDGSGNVYVADFLNDRVRKIDTSGTITTIAGNGTSTFFGSGDGGPATDAALTTIRGLFVRNGEVYLTGRDGADIRKVGTNGIIQEVAGGGGFGFSGDGGPATEAALSLPNDIHVAEDGTMYIADTGNNRIRKVDTSGVITTIAGSGSEGFSGDGGPATDAALDDPWGVFADGEGNVYIADRENHRIRKVDAAGTITTIAGNSDDTGPNTFPGFDGDGGQAQDAILNNPVDVWVTDEGVVYVLDHGNNRVRMIDGQGVISTVAGSNVNSGFEGDGGPATVARLSRPEAFAFDPVGNLYVADTNNHRIRKIQLSDESLPAEADTALRTITLDVEVSDSLSTPEASNPYTFTIGTPSDVRIVVDSALDIVFRLYLGSSAGDITSENLVAAVDAGFAGAETLESPLDAGAFIVVVESFEMAAAGPYTISVADLSAGSGNEAPSTPASGNPGDIVVIAGTGVEGYSGDGGAATDAQIQDPAGIWVDANGVVFFADADNNRVRRIDEGVITTFVGNGESDFSGDGGPATEAGIRPVGLVGDGEGNLYVSTANHRIRRISADGTVSTFAGTGVQGLSGDGGPASEAELGGPTAMWIREDGAMLFADSGNNRVRLISDGIIQTVAGAGPAGPGFSVGHFAGDGGPATEASLDTPSDIAVDSEGRILIADALSVRVRRIESDGTITTVAGTGATGAFGGGAPTGDEGPATEAVISFPNSILPNEGGGFLIAASTGLIRQVDADGIITTLAGNGSVTHLENGPALSVGMNPGPMARGPDGNLYFTDRQNDRVYKWVVASSAPSADFDGDGTVGFVDFLEFSAVFGATSTSTNFDSRFDLDGDGAIGFPDFLVFAGAFGTSG